MAADYDITTSADSLEFDVSDGEFPALTKIDTNHFLVVYEGTGNDGFSHVLEVDTSDWSVSTASAGLEFDTVSASWLDVEKVDTNHFLVGWTEETATDERLQVLEVNTTTWAITTSAAYFVVNSTTNSGTNKIIQVDTNHFLLCWYSDTASPYSARAQIVEVNTTTWAVTTSAAHLELDSGALMPITGAMNIDVIKVDTNHFLMAWAGTGNDGFVQTLEVNTSTWAVTTSAASLEYDASRAGQPSFVKIDDNHFNIFYEGTGNDGFASILEVNTSTWAITTTSTTEWEIDRATHHSGFRIDNSHMGDLYTGPSADGFASSFVVDRETWAVSTVGSEVEFDTAIKNVSDVHKIDTNHFLMVWTGVGGDGFSQVINVHPRLQIFRGPTTSSGTGTTSDPLEFNHTVDQGTDVLIVYAGGLGSPRGISTVTFDGDSLTKLTEGSYDDTGTGDPSMGIWYLANPVAKTATISIQPDDVTPTGMSGICHNYFGVDPDDPFDVSANAGGDSASPSDTITSTVTDGLLIGAILENGGGTITPNGDLQTIVQQTPVDFSAESVEQIASYAAAYTPSYSIASAGWAVAHAILKPKVSDFVFDNKTSYDYSSGDADETFYHEILTEEDNRLFVLIALGDENGSGLANSPTYAGQTMTKAVEHSHSTDNAIVEIWYLIDPPSGFNQVSMTSDTGTANFRIIASSYYNTGGTVALDDTSTGDGTSASAAVTVQPAEDDNLLVSGMSTEDGDVPVGGTNYRLLNATDEGVWANASGYDMQGTKADQTFTYTLAASDFWAAAGATFKTAGAPPASNARFLTILGVGS